MITINKIQLLNNKNEKIKFVALSWINTCMKLSMWALITSEKLIL